MHDESLDNPRRLKQAFDQFVSAVQTAINKGTDGNVSLKINLTKGRIAKKAEIVSAEYPHVE